MRVHACACMCMRELEGVILDPAAPEEEVVEAAEGRWQRAGACTGPEGRPGSGRTSVFPPRWEATGAI